MSYRNSPHYRRRTRIIIPAFALTIAGLCLAGIALGGSRLRAPYGESTAVITPSPRERSQEVPILLYHNIGPHGKYAVSEQVLRRHFEIIRASGFIVVSLTDILAMSRAEKARPAGRMIAITFDDGFKSMYTSLLPLVREFGYPVTLFVYTDFIAGNPGSLLTWDELRTMSRSGISIQNHSRSHIDLTVLLEHPSPGNNRRLFEELYLTRRLLEAELDSPVTLFAFPYGYYSPELVQLARSAGYSNVFSTDFGPNDIRWQNFCLRRHHILKTTTDDDLLRIMQ
jgi:peptidoglycan/xylan/chitin deacetylase (PgdA/CDA1 family)